MFRAVTAEVNDFDIIQNLFSVWKFGAERHSVLLEVVKSLRICNTWPAPVLSALFPFVAW